MPKIKVDKETAKVLDKLNAMRTAHYEKLELKMAEFDKPVTLQELAKGFRKSQKDTFKSLAKLIKLGLVEVNLTPVKKLMK